MRTRAPARSRRTTLGSSAFLSRAVRHQPDASWAHSTGKRSKEGALQDGINSLIRYIKNNFLDGPRQDAYDLVTGTWVPRKGEELGWTDKRELAIRAVSSGKSARLTKLTCSLSQAPWILVLGLFALFITFFAAAFVNGDAGSTIERGNAR